MGFGSDVREGFAVRSRLSRKASNRVVSCPGAVTV